MKQVDHLYIVLFRGNANNSSNAGFSYANSNYVPYFCKRVILINKLNDISDKDYKQNICSWLGWTKYSNSRHLLKTIIKPKYYGSIL